MKKSKTSDVLGVLDTMILVPALAGRPQEAQCYNALIINGPGKLVCSEEIIEEYASVIQRYGFPASWVQLELSKLSPAGKYRYYKVDSEGVEEDLAPRKDRHIIAPCKEGFANLVVTNDSGILERKDNILSKTGARVLTLREALDLFTSDSKS